MRYLGIDYGEKRIGVALSDKNGQMAFAYGVLVNVGNEKVSAEIKKICAENSVGKIVLGKSLNYKGKRNKLARDLRKRNAYFG